MKILHITKKYPNALGGDAVVVQNLENQQKLHGHEVAILTTNCAEINKGDQIHKFGLRDTPAGLDGITLKRLVSLAHLITKSFRVIRKERPDVIHTHSIDMAFAASFAARWYRVPTVHTFHVVTFCDKNQSWLRRKTELLFKKGANPDLITAPNKSDVKHLQDTGIGNAELLPNGIDLDFWSKGKKDKEEKTRKNENNNFTFIAVARLEHQKGLEYLVRAAAILKDQTAKQFTVKIVGDGSLRKKLTQLTQELGADDHIDFIGRKNPQEVRALYKASDVAVFPSLWETGPITAYEAWAMHLPVITTQTGIFQDEPDDSNLVEIVKISDKNSLANSMKKLLNDPKRRDVLKNNGYKLAQSHSWSKIYNKAESLYKKITGEQTTRNDAKNIAASAADNADNDVAGSSSQDQIQTKHTALNTRNAVIALTAAGAISLLASQILPVWLNLILTLPLAVLTPGLLLQQTVFKSAGDKSLALAISVGAALGILIIMLESCLINWLLPIAGEPNPLQKWYLLAPHLSITAGLLTAYLYQRGAQAAARTIRLSLNLKNTLRAAIPMLLPLLAAAGAFRLNNGFGNHITIVALLAMAGLAVWYIARPKHWNPAWLIFNIALGLLLSTSLRSWFVSGFDISQEFQVFNLTLQNYHWNLNALPQNAYNACLSLTTMPAMLQQIVGATPEYIYKFLYQMAFALTAVVIYLLGLRVTNKPRIAFLASMLFTAQAQFVGTMPAVVRQEIGLLFFALIIYLLLERKRLGARNGLLVALLGLGMVLSHYSTTYIAIFVLGLAALMLWTLRLPRIRERLAGFNPALSAVGISLLTLFLGATSYVWYSKINPSSSSNLKSTLSQTWQGITDFKGLNTDQDGNRMRLILGGNRGTRPEDVYEYKKAMGITQSITPSEATTLPEKNHVAVWLAARGRDLLAIMVKILLPLSSIILLLNRKARKKTSTITLVGVSGLVTFMSFVVLPALSQSYNVERVLQQLLIIWAVTGVWALWTLAPHRKALITGGFVVLYFVLSPGTGVVNQIIGGSAPRLNLNSAGEEYQRYYAHQSEALSAIWAGKNCEANRTWADRYATLRLTAYSDIPFDSIKNDVLKADDGCVVLDAANVQGKVYYAGYDGRPVRYSIQAGTFNDRNLLYTNGQSQVYSR